MSKFRDSRLYDALDYLDEAYIAEVVENLKVPPAPGMPARKGGQLRYIITLAACILVLSMAIPVITYVMRNYADLPGWLISDTTENTSPELTEPETPPSETTAPPAPETSEDTDHETTAPLYDGTTAEPEVEYDGSRGLMYKMNDDGKSYYLSGMGICTDENIVVASTYDGYPVTMIGESALSGYDRVKSVTIPDSVTVIDHYAFMNCSALENVTIPDKVTYIGAEAFSGTSIKNIELPTGLTYLSIGAFKDCPIEEVVIPDSVEVINSAFWGCSELKSVTIGRNAAEIKTLAFYGCKKLTDLIFDGTVEEWNMIKKIEDWNAESVISVVHCTDGDVKIEPHQQLEPEYDGSRGLEYKISDDGKSAFLVGIGTCTDKDIVTATTYNGLPVTEIGGGFFNIDTIRSVTVSENVTYIEGLRVCDNLEEVHLPKSLSALYIDALKSNPRLKVITIDPSNPQFSAVGNCLIKKETKTLIVGCTGSVIPSDGSVLYIGDEAFRGAGMTEITIPNGIIRFDGYAFASCESLKSVKLPDSVTTVGYAVFYGCTSLESFEFSENTKTIGSWVFSGCISLKEVKMPTYGSIGEGVFDDCTSLESIVIPIGQDILHIGTFSNCASLETVVLPDTLTQIHSPFPDCISLKSITIPAGVTIIEHYAFYNCATLSEFNFKGTIAEWKAMEKENGWNRSCPFTVIHCSDGDISP